MGEKFEKKKKMYICICNFVYVFFFLFPFFGYSFLLIIKGGIQSSILLCCFVLVLRAVHLTLLCPTCCNPIRLLRRSDTGPELQNPTPTGRFWVPSFKPC